MPACRADCVHVAEAAHVLGAWELRGMSFPVLRAWVVIQHDYTCRHVYTRLPIPIWLLALPVTWTWKSGSRKWRKSSRRRRHGWESDTGIWTGKASECSFSVPAYRTRKAQRPVKACQDPGQRPCDGAVSLCCC